MGVLLSLINSLVIELKYVWHEFMGVLLMGIFRGRNPTLPGLRHYFLSLSLMLSSGMSASSEIRNLVALI